MLFILSLLFCLSFFTRYAGSLSLTTFVCVRVLCYSISRSSSSSSIPLPNTPPPPESSRKTSIPLREVIADVSQYRKQRASPSGTSSLRSLVGNTKHAVDTDLETFITKLNFAIVSCRILAANTDLPIADDSPRPTPSELDVVPLELAKEIASAVLHSSIEDLAVENSSATIIARIQELVMQYPAQRQYFTTLLFILSPVLRLASYHKENSQANSQRKASVPEPSLSSSALSSPASDVDLICEGGMLQRSSSAESASPAMLFRSTSDRPILQRAISHAVSFLGGALGYSFTKSIENNRRALSDFSSFTSPLLTRASSRSRVSTTRDQATVDAARLSAINRLQTASHSSPSLGVQLMMQGMSQDSISISHDTSDAPVPYSVPILSRPAALDDDDDDDDVNTTKPVTSDSTKPVTSDSTKPLMNPTIMEPSPVRLDPSFDSSTPPMMAPPIPTLLTSAPAALVTVEATPPTVSTSSSRVKNTTAEAEEEAVVPTVGISQLVPTDVHGTPATATATATASPRTPSPRAISPSGQIIIIDTSIPVPTDSPPALPSASASVFKSIAGEANGIIIASASESPDASDATTSSSVSVSASSSGSASASTSASAPQSPQIRSVGSSVAASPLEGRRPTAIPKLALHHPPPSDVAPQPPSAGHVHFKPLLPKLNLSSATSSTSSSSSSLSGSSLKFEQANRRRPSRDGSSCEESSEDESEYESESDTDRGRMGAYGPVPLAQRAESEIDLTLDTITPVRLVCRICENQIRVDQVEEHNAHCKIAAECCSDPKRTTPQKLELLMNAVTACIQSQNRDDYTLHYLRVLLGITQKGIECCANFNRSVCEDIMDHLKLVIDRNLNNTDPTVLAYANRIRLLLKRDFMLKLTDSGMCTPRSIRTPRGKGNATLDEYVHGEEDNLTMASVASIDDFEIIKPISRGAFGRVWLVRKRATGDLFAMKAVKKSDMIDKNLVNQVIIERNIMAASRNPYVVTLFYAFQNQRYLFYVMEYLYGGDCSSLLESIGCFTEEMARVYIAETVMALEYLHSLGIVHRDVKPGMCACYLQLS